MVEKEKRNSLIAKPTLESFIGKEVIYRVAYNNQIFIEKGILQKITSPEHLTFSLAYIGADDKTNFAINLNIVQVDIEDERKYLTELV